MHDAGDFLYLSFFTSICFAGGPTKRLPVCVCLHVAGCGDGEAVDLVGPAGIVAQVLYPLRTCTCSHMSPHAHTCQKRGSLCSVPHN